MIKIEHHLPRENWQSIAQKIGYDYYENDDKTYAWSENLKARVSQSDLARILKASQELYTMCLSCVEDITKDDGLMDQFEIPKHVRSFIIKSWKTREPDLIGRFDFAVQDESIKLIEYNADTPATIPESTAMQKIWSKHHNLTDAAWIGHALVKRLKKIRQAGYISNHLHIMPYPGCKEDIAHGIYYTAFAKEAGLDARVINIHELMKRPDGYLYHNGERITALLKMYPWEIMFRERGSVDLESIKTKWLSPAWTSLLSNKALLALLWKKYPNHPLLLKTTFEENDFTNTAYAKKAIFSRGGADVTYHNGEKILQSNKSYYDKYPKVYQEWTKTQIDGWYTNVGAWMIGPSFSGLSFRIDKKPIIQGESCLIPHYIL